ncbi:MAG: hypothetical protein Q9219_004397 [cf. Caloplaca sp. 3 TL-2023]
MSEQELTFGAVVEITQPEPGQYKVAQKNLSLGVPPSDDQSRKSIDWSFGPVKVSGYLELDKLELGVSVSIIGISLGNFYGSLQDGVGIDVGLFVVKGSIKFYLKNGNELWVYLGLNVTFDGNYEGDYKIMSF